MLTARRLRDVSAGLVRRPSGGENPEETMAGRRKKRSDGRCCINITVEDADGLNRRVYFYGRAQAEAKGKAEAPASGWRSARPCGTPPVRSATGSTSSGGRSSWPVTGRSRQRVYALTLRHVEPVIGRTPLGQVRPSDITRVLLTMEPGGSAASTRRDAYAAILRRRQKLSATPASFASSWAPGYAVARPSHYRTQQSTEQNVAANRWETTGFVFVTEFGRPADHGTSARDDPVVTESRTAGGWRPPASPHLRHDRPAARGTHRCRKPESRPFIDRHHR